MRKLKLFLIAFVLTGSLYAQDKTAEKYASTITKEDLHEDLSILASDALEGRETGTRGQKMAAAFISAHFESLGLMAPVKNGDRKSYLQPVELYSTVPGDIFIEVNGKKKKNFEDIVYYGTSSTNNIITSDIVFAGNGSEEDFNQVKAEGKAALIFVNSLRDPKLMQNAEKAKVSVLFAVTDASDEDFKTTTNRFKRYLSGGRLSLEKPSIATGSADGVFLLSPTTAAEIFNTSAEKLRAAANDSGKKSLKKIKTSTIKYQTQQKVKTVSSENVLGYLEGSDKKNELVVVTAHYDHEGIKNGQVYNGADDDGSGTSAVLEIAEAFAKAKEDGNGPRRSMLFMTVTGEEKGLLGSSYYTSNPVFPLENTVVDLNIDMIGRIDEKHKDDINYLYLVGADKLSSELHTISEKANDTYTKFELDYTYNDENHPERIYYRSDHWNFAKNNIPVIFYFNGTHEDYHQPTDTVDKINFDLLEKRAKLVFYTAWELANREERIKVDKPSEQKVNQE
ncbi:M28 family peptidase [Fulvivirga sediminis]|uniref:M28 family peptidase n=1 Tax=Fulvivirga sediminis TaxID=2803949 RepID=A0A937FAR7_9BACT|nr:M28 family peptidase [Fulvivirga sediminis]MBL3657048.1 M28 family peptidase [Fulvivirga sediminis]